MKRVDATIGKLRRHASLRRVIAPPHPRIIGIGGISMMTMGKFCFDQADFAQITARHHRLHVAHQRIAGIAIVNRTNLSCRTGNFDNFLAFFDCHGHRFFTQDVKATFQKCFGNLKMGVVGRRHRHQINPVTAFGLASQHFTPIPIGPVRCNAQALCKSAPRLWVVIQSASHKRKSPIKPSPKPVRRTDLAAVTAANHSPV